MLLDRCDRRAAILGLGLYYSEAGGKPFFAFHGDGEAKRPRLYGYFALKAYFKAIPCAGRGSYVFLRLYFPVADQHSEGFRRTGGAGRTSRGGTYIHAEISVL